MELSDFEDYKDFARTWAMFCHINNYLETEDKKHIELLKKSQSIDIPIQNEKKPLRTPVNTFNSTSHWTSDNKNKTRRLF